MATTPYILNEIQSIDLGTTVAELKEAFKSSSYSHLPIVKDKVLIGLISETDMEGIEDSEKEIGNFYDLFQLFFSEESSNLLEILKLFAIHETNLVPVVNAQKNYIGYYDLIDILHEYNDTPFMKHEGELLILEKEIHDYSFFEVCQIVESNKGQVLGLFISESSDEKIKITLKFDAQEINEIIQSFRRYNYRVLSNHKEDLHLEDLIDRSNYLQKYLNI